MGLAYLILLISIIASLIICARVKYNTMVQDGGRLKSIVTAAAEDINRHFAKLSSMMDGVRGLFLASSRVSPQEWNIFLDSLGYSPEATGLCDLGFAMRVKAGELGEHQTRLGRERADYKVVPEGAREEYFPIIYLRDQSVGNVRALGWDAYSSEERSKAMDRARDKAEAACTARLQMVLPNGDHPVVGHVVYLPVYRGSVTPATLEERREKLMGFVFTSFRAEDLWSAMLSARTRKYLDVEIFDNGTLIFDSVPDLAPGQPRKGQALGGENRLRMAGQKWTARVTTLERFDAESSRNAVWWVALGCAAFSFTLFALARKQAKDRLKAERVMNNLRRSEQALSESEARFRGLAEDARRSEERLSRIVETIADGVLILDGEGKIKFANAAATEILGMTNGDELEIRKLVKELRVTRRRSFSYTYQRSEQAPLVLAINAAPFANKDSETIGVVASIRDVSLEKENEDSLVQSQTRLRILNNILGLMAAGAEVTQIVVRTVNELSRFFPDYRIVFSQARDGEGWQAVCSEGALDSVKGAMFNIQDEPELKEEFFGAKPLVAPNLDLDERFARLRQGKYFSGARAALEQPLRHGPKLAGLLSFHCPYAHEWTASEKVMLQEIADYIAAAYAQFDVAEQRREAESALEAEKERLAVTLRSIADGVITTDIEGKVVLMNRAAEAITGWTQAEALGRVISEVFQIVDEKSRDQIENPALRVLRDDSLSVAGLGAILIGHDGIERIVTESAAAIRDQHSQVIGAALVFRDVTEKRRIERELQKASKLESVGLLAGGIAHDFNNILSVILGNVTLCKMMAPAGSNLQNRLGQAEKGTLRARELTQQLLTFAKGGAPIRKAASIAEIVQESTAFAARGSNVECQVESAKDLWAVEIDEGQMSQVFNNLVINAVQAMPEGGKLRMRMENLFVTEESGLPLAAGRFVHITVQDTGTGISREHLPRIFDPYFSTKSSGSGLGLATTYAIIQKHQGLITVESASGEGSTFHIYLPATSAPVIPKTQKQEPAPIGGGRVLVMDDEAAILDLAQESLRRFGYDVETAVHGAEAIEKYQAARNRGKPFAAVIMDLTVPGAMGGKEAMKRLVEIDPKVRGIVSSGYSHDPVMANFKEFGFSGVVEKPYQVETLAKALARIIYGSRN